MFDETKGPTVVPYIGPEEVIRRLELLAARLDSVPIVNFCMATYFIVRRPYGTNYTVSKDANGNLFSDPPIFDEEKFEAVARHECYTAACAVGFACTIPEFAALGLYWTACREVEWLPHGYTVRFPGTWFFGLKGGNREHIFYSADCTPKQKTGQIRDLIEKLRRDPQAQAMPIRAFDRETGKIKPFHEMVEDF